MSASTIKVGDKGLMKINGMASRPCTVVATGLKGWNGKTLAVKYKLIGGTDDVFMVHEGRPDKHEYYFEKDPTYLYRNEYRSSRNGQWHNEQSLCIAGRTTVGGDSPDFIGLLRCEVDSYGEKLNFTFIPKEEIE